MKSTGSPYLEDYHYDMVFSFKLSDFTHSRCFSGILRMLKNCSEFKKQRKCRTCIWCLDVCFLLIRTTKKFGTRERKEGDLNFFQRWMQMTCWIGHGGVECQRTEWRVCVGGRERESRSKPPRSNTKYDNRSNGSGSLAIYTGQLCGWNGRRTGRVDNEWHEWMKLKRGDALASKSE